MATIELDCSPGGPRPDDLLPKALEGTELTPNDFEIVSKFFGNWTFELNALKEDIYATHRNTIMTNIKILYDRGFIRYGSW
jgi:hypothetical protein